MDANKREIIYGDEVYRTKPNYLNYLKATKLPVGLIINFGSPKLEWKRYANTRSSKTQPFEAVINFFYSRLFAFIRG